MRLNSSILQLKSGIGQYGSVNKKSRLGNACALPNKVLIMLGFVPQPNLP
jgi:hypothetical protein